MAGWGLGGCERSDVEEKRVGLEGVVGGGSGGKKLSDNSI